MIRKLSIFLVLGIAVSVPAALASSLTLSISEDGGPALASASSVTGLVQIAAQTLGDFTVSQAIGVGLPTLATPGLNLQTLDIAAGPLSSTHTITVILTQYGLTSPLTSMPVLNAYTGILAGITSETVSSYVDSTNGGGTTVGDLVGTSTFAGPTLSYSKDVFGTATTSALFSETEVITAVFAKGSNDDLNANAVLSGTSSVPEPASIALIGIGLMGLSMVRRRSAKN